MKKMVLLASMMALAALMLAAAPAFAQPVTVVDGLRFSPGNCGNLEGITLTREQAEALVENPDELPDSGNVCLLTQPDGQDGDGQARDRDGDGFFDFDEPFISQDIEQEAESGDITQNFDVSQTGDNSNQTVSTQGVANTGNAQNVIDVVDAGDFGDFDGDRVFVDHNDGICEDDNDEDCFFFGDDVFFGDDGVFVLGDDNGECDENGDDEDCIVIVDDFFGDFGDFDGDFDGDVEIEDSGASIELSPTQTVTSDQQVNQAAAASGDDCVPVWDPWWQTWVCLPT